MLLAIDPADQRATPLEVVRSAVREPTAVLRAAGVGAVVRDDFDERHLPDDVYDLAPRAVGDLGDPELGPQLLAWGLAKSARPACPGRERRRRGCPAALRGVAWYHLGGGGRTVLGDGVRMTDLASNATADDPRAARRAALENLGEPELLALAYDAPVGLFAAVAPFGNVLVNKRMCEITGRRNRDLLGDLWFDAVHPDDRERLTALFRDAMDGDGTVDAEHRVERPDGRARAGCD